MRASSCFARGLIFALAALPTAGCSVILQPSLEGLVPPDGPVRTDGDMTGDATLDVIGPDTPMMPDVPRPDVPVQPDAPPTDTPMTCSGDCNDGVSCTVDLCNAGACQHTPDNMMCSGGQVCDATMGCVARHCANNSDCNDSNPCTNDVCGSGGGPGNGCTNTPIDADGDGYPALNVGTTMCTGGTDCDDANPAAHPGVTETCNGVDDNCDGLIDNVTGTACAPANDACSGAVAVSLDAGATRMVTGTTFGAMNGVDSFCGNRGGGDVWYAVTYPANQVLEAFVQAVGPRASSGDPVLVLRSSCSSTTDIICDDDISGGARSSRIWVRPERGATGPITRYFVVDAYQSGAEYDFDLQFRTTADPLPATCLTAQLDVSEGGAVLGRYPMQNLQTGSCTTSTTRPNEDIYTYNGLGGTVNLNLFVAGTGGSWQPGIYVRDTCALSTTERTCQVNNPARTSFTHSSGAQSIFVDNGQSGATYQLTVTAP